MSALDDDGNETAGIRHPDITVPLATYTGLNLRHERAGAPDSLIPAAGAMYPFAVDEQTRLASDDLRPSLEERYKDVADYMMKVRIAARELVSEGFLLTEDVDRIVTEAAAKYRALTAATAVTPDQSESPKE